MKRALVGEFYRFYKERRGLVPFFIFNLIILLFSFVIKSEVKELEIQTTLSNISSMFPLFLLMFYIFFIGDEFAYRTINILLINTKSRTRIFVQKILSVFIASLVFLIYTYSTVFLFLRVGDYSQFIWIFCHQLPYFICIITFAILIFIFFDKIYEASLIYVIYTLLFDNLLSFITEAYFPFLHPFYIFLNFKESVFYSIFSVENTVYPLIMAVFLLLLSFYLFNQREFK